MVKKKGYRTDPKNIIKTLELLTKATRDSDAPLKEFEKVQTNDPFKVLVATILSSRTKDEVTTEAAKRLFSVAKNLEELSKLSVNEIEALIYPVGFYKNKARFLSALPSALEAFGGKIPSSMDRLLSLPGVGRKTANLVLARAFGKPTICVDTHVHRLSNLWGWVRTNSPEETEKALKELLPKRYWSRVNSVLVAFGQSVCKPVSPMCVSCPLNDWCPGKKLQKNEAIS